MAVKEILQFGNPILTRISRRVDKIDEEILGIVKDMKDTLKVSYGVGLAAPQIGVLKRIILIDLQDGSEPIVLLNPKIIGKIGKENSVEGCLSYPGYEGELIRPRKVIVTGTTLENKVVEFTATGLLGKVFCHEIDHLDGIVYTDRAKKMYKLEEEEQ